MAKAFGRCTLAAVLVAGVALAGAVEENAIESSRGGKAGDSVGSPTTMIAEMARELITKSYSNSQVLSLNLSNVLILLLIKAVLFAISQYSAGGRGFGGFGNFWGRSYPNSNLDTQPRALEPADPYATERDLLLALSYLRSESVGDYECLNMVACEDPNGRAPKYLEAAKMLLKGAKVMSPIMPMNPRYEIIVEGIEKAIKYGAAGGNCNHYKCKLQE
ncbi:uncharacterized protein LOC132200201 [Neocloeon triangulifer]|uniref:uncharacterized protein LOC132200201 n=1 Tax=Neocloeon triangulifer TaxID=2078957 RepID=UPI00286EF141|nr:uncharacterized protein LOC132200201 [Neocloeon triangulifer]XP_059481454.1 uncharacterized protein LOC132200201 [Neocloeon triangulifer]